MRNRLLEVRVDVQLSVEEAQKLEAPLLLLVSEVNDLLTSQKPT